MRARQDRVTDIRGVILDVDGTLVRGDQSVPGAAETLARLEAAGIDPLLLSNNPTEPAEGYARRLADVGLDVEPDRILTAGELTAAWLEREYPDADVLVFGSEGLRTVLREHGCSLTTDPAAADVVLASFDRTFNYDDMETALHALAAADVVFVGTDPDRTIPTDDRPVPGSGAIVDAVAAVSDRDPDVVIGKPSPIAREAALDRLGLDPADCLVVGDRLDTDVALADGTDLTTALVRTGVTDPAGDTPAASSVTPDHVLDSIADLDALIDGRS